MQLLKNPPQSPFVKGGRKGEPLKFLPLPLTLNRAPHILHLTGVSNWPADQIRRTSRINPLTPLKKRSGGLFSCFLQSFYAQAFCLVCLMTTNFTGMQKVHSGHGNIIRTVLRSPLRARIKTFSVPWGLTWPGVYSPCLGTHPSG